MSDTGICIIDYDAGNVRSVQRALEYCGSPAVISGDPDIVSRASGIVLPGQGANDSSMRQLRARRLVEPIREFIASGRPFLGVCLGLQLLLESSDEGAEAGLGVIKGRVKRFPEGLKVPQMGWNRVQIRKEHPVLNGIASGSYFYFVHSYYADPDDDDVVAGTTNYGGEFCSAVAFRNVVAVQFHPEKSGEVGLRLYRNFVDTVQHTEAGMGVQRG